VGHSKTPDEVQRKHLMTTDRVVSAGSSMAPKAGGNGRRLGEVRTRALIGRDWEKN
jgi:hypothetical protein